MPITRKQFEIGVDPEIEEWMKKIHTFLTEHKDEAFTADELKNQWKVDFDLSTWILAKLIELGAAERRAIHGKYYYSCGLSPLEI